MGKSQMIERINGENFEYRMGHILVLGVQLIVFLLVFLGFLGSLFLFFFVLAFIGELFMGVATVSLNYWRPGLFSVFLIFFKFPRLNVIWENIFKKLT